jgi:replicative DNA helicase
MGDVTVGDQLLGADGRPVRVVAATEVMHGRPCYEVEFSDGEVIVADAQHQWLTDTRASRKSAQAAAAGYNRYRYQRTFAAARTTEEICRTLRCATADRRPNHSVAVAKPLQLPEAELPLAPYALGVWLGDGSSASACFTSADPEIAVHIEADGLLAPFRGDLRYELRLPDRERPTTRNCVVCGEPFVPMQTQVKTCGRTGGARSRYISDPVPAPRCPDCGQPSSGWGDGRCQECWRSKGSVQAILRTIGVLGNKYVPISYLRASEPQRRLLLAGLLDTDGTVSPGGTVQFATTSPAVAEGVKDLVAGLGYRPSVMQKSVNGHTAATSTCYTINFRSDDEVFRLERKRLMHKERTRTHAAARRASRFIGDVRPISSVPVRCVQVDNADHLYLAGRSMIPTHNSTLALDWARSASVKHHMASVIFSLEMSRTEITMRLLSAEAEIKLAAMRSGRMGDAEWRKIVRRMGEISDAPLFIDDSPNMTMMEIRAKARRLKQRHDLKLIVVDYLQLMTGGKRAESRQQEVSEISRQMKLLAKELEVPVVAISQLNRGPEQRTDKRPMLADLRESGSLEQDADMVILVHRPDAWEAEDPRAGEADLIVAKHRNGPTATVTVAHQLHYSRFKDLAAM